MKFKEGDRVMYECLSTHKLYQIKGQTGTVVEQDRDTNVVVLWDDGKKFGVFPGNLKPAKQTALIKYDLYPFYVVFSGFVQNGEEFVLGEGPSYFKMESVIKLLPIESLEEEEKKRDKLESDYRRLTTRLQKKLLTDVGMGWYAERLK